MIFKTFEEINKKTGEVSEKVGLTFGNFKREGFQNARAGKANTDTYYSRQALANEAKGLNEVARANAAYNMAIENGVDAKKAMAERDTRAAKAAEKYGDAVKKQQNNLHYTNKQVKEHIANGKKQIALDKERTKVSSSTKAMFGNIGAMLLLDIAFKAAGWAWDTLNDKFKITPEKKIEAMETAINKYNDAISQSSENTKTIKSLKDEFNQLAKGVDESGKNISLSAEEYSRYNEIANQLASISPSIIQGYTAEGNAILDRNSAIEEGIRAQEEYAAAATRAYTSNSTGDDIIKGSTENLKSSLKDSREDLVNIGKAFDDLHSYAIASNNYGAAGKDKASGIISDYFGREVNLSQASLDDLERIDTEWNSIIQNAKQSGYSEEIIANAQAEYGALHSSIANIQDAYQPIYQWLSTVVSQADATGKSISEAIPEGMQAGFQAGLKNIAMSGKSASEMRIDATNLANQLSASYRANVDNVRDIYREAEKAKKDFANEDIDADQANEALATQAERLDKLAEKYKSTDAVLSAFYQNEANNLRDFVANNEHSISNAIGTFDDLISAARNAKSEFDSALEGGDYYTGIEAFNSIYDTMFNGQNNIGNGSLAFWQGAEQLLGTSALKEAGYNISKVKDQLAEIQPLLQGGAQGASLFAEKLLSIGDGKGNILNDYGEVIGQVSDTANGITFDIPRENVAEVARKLGVSSEMLTAMIDSARQFANVDFYNVEEVKKAIQSAAKEQEKALQGSDGTLYMDFAELQSQSGLQGVELDGLIDDLAKVNVNIIDADASAKTLRDTFTNMGNLSNNTLNLDSTIKDFYKLGTSADDLAQMLSTLQHDGVNLGDMGGDESALDYILDKYAELDEVGIEQDPMEQATESVEKLTDSVNVLIETLGGIPPIDIEVNEEKLDKSLGDIEGLKDADKEMVITAVTEYKDDGDLEKLASTINSLPEEVRPNVVTAVTDAISNIELVDGSLQTLDGKSAYPIVGIVDNASSKLSGIASTLSSIGSTVATAVVNVAKTVTEKTTKASKAKGTPGRRPQTHYPSMASGGTRGRIGPHNKGGLTLTGELGTELAWIPSQGISFLVGQYGPEMVDLPPDAVVYSADETRRILGDTVPLHSYNFGSLANGNVLFGSAGGSATGTIKRYSSSSNSSSKTRKSSSSSSSSSSSESAYEKAKKKLDHELEMGYITEKQYYDRLLSLYNKYKGQLAKEVDDQRAALEDLRKAWVNAYESAKDLLDHQLEMNVISEAQYYEKLKALGDQYYKGRADYANEYRDHLEELKDARKEAYDAQLEDLDKALEKELITIEQYFSKVQSLQNQYLTGNEMAKEREEALDDMYDQLKDALDNQWDDILQKIDDNELFGVWVENAPEALTLMQDFYDQIANDGRKYFQTQKEYDEYLLELKRDIADAQKDIYKDQQDDLETLLDLVEDMLRQEADDYIEVLRKQKDTFNDLIDKKKEMLQLAEDELALQEELEDGNRQMADIQNQIAILSRDDSRAAKAKIAELQKELADLQRDQNKTIRDETLSKTEDALDKQAEIFEKIIDKQIEVVENWLNNKSAVIEVVADTIAQKETNNLLERLISYNGEHGDALLSTVDKAWKDISTLTKEYGTDINKIVEALQKGIDVNITGGLISSDQTDYAKTQAETKNTPTHHAGIAAGFTGNGADLKQHEVYRLLTDDELVFNREDQMRIASQLQVLDTIKSSYSNLAKNIDSQSVAAMPRAVELTVNAPVTIEGNASPDTIKQLEEFGNSIADATLTKLNDALRVNGVHSRAASNMRKN